MGWSPYQALFAWLEGRAPAPQSADLPIFYPLMLAQPLDDADSQRSTRATIGRVEMGRIPCAARQPRRRKAALLRSGDEIGWRSGYCGCDAEEVTLDGELWWCAAARRRRSTICSSGSTARSRPKMLRDYPARGAALRHSTRGTGRSARPVLCRAPQASRGTACAGIARGARSFTAGAVFGLDSCANCATARASAASRG